MQTAWEQEVENTGFQGEERKPSLMKVLCKVFGFELVLYGLILAAMEFLIRATSNTYFSRLFKYYDVSSGITWGEAVFFSFGLIFCSMANVMIQHPFMMGVMHLGMKMRVGVCSLIYRKLMTAYLYREMGISAVYGALMIVAAVPFQIFLGTRTSHYRRKTALKSDERVRLMEEIVMGIEVIKMYTWEKPFRKIIDTVRRQEVHYIKMTSYIRGMVMSFIMFTARFSIFITVLLYVVYVNRITVENVFFLTCYYNILKQTMTLFFPQAVGQIAEMNVAVQRINDFLLSEECRLPSRTQSSELPLPHNKPKKRVTIPLNPVRPPKRRSPRTEPNTSTIKSQDKPKELRKDQIAIKFDEACSRWIKSSAKDDVKDITLSIYGGSLTTIIGAVGSGKSTLLQMMLSELPCSTGSMDIMGSVSYASQDPWLFVGSVRQNIIFGQPFVKSRYMEVCKVCALERDISLFPHGDKTIVGERGVSLSGGQRARINLARAVYKEADIYLLDDPLSAVDTQVARHIFENCIKGYLESKTVILVTHQLQFIKSVDQIVIVEKGKIIADGDYNDLTDQKREEEAQIVGRVKGSVYKEYFSADSAYIFVALVFCMFVLAQFFASASDYWISRWSNAEDHLTGDKTMDNLLWSQHGIEGSKVGLIITQSISLTGIFQWGMRQSAEMENQMTSVERVLEYTKLPQEVTPDTPDQKPPEDWPTDGAIQFEHLSLRYSPSGDHVLNDLQFNILPQEKIGIVGRTGAGKSSIIQALFRLAYLDGTINIDGIDITSIGINYLRQKISIIPQEPVLFSGSLRKNLDPFDEYPDVLLLRALDKVELLSEDENVEALYKQVSDCGSNFSVGERQLVCLARAIVNNDKILLLDEATANVDAQTDALIQTAIKEHFRSCTVLTVAHRLNTVIDSDKILVLDAGYLVEFDHPHLLLQNRKGYFRKMVAETGPAMSQLLHKLAADVRDCILAIKAT
ncbi:jg26826 [Pararge aegeria aegeria]|uniref:Jg26826 protein n=1 Tax=Pararge aegeria aegeria TaxID=348720 RepID=A0A8S4SAA5_9NEOP|nr:jg26826 [Pararge aegeria aegeria]